VHYSRTPLLVNGEIFEMCKSKEITFFENPKEPHEYISGHCKGAGKPELKRNCGALIDFLSDHGLGNVTQINVGTLISSALPQDLLAASEAVNEPSRERNLIGRGTSASEREP